jgi:hypothetical protein
MRQGFPLGCAELGPLIAAISKELAQKRVKAEQGRQHQRAAVAILDVGGMHHHMQQQA